MANKKDVIKMSKVSTILNMIIILLLIMLGIFTAYQIARILLGGSWAAEDVLITLNGVIIISLFVIVGYMISLSKATGRLEANFENLKNSFCSLAKDFKQHCSP